MGLIANVACTALVFEGGGYRAGYTAGIADVLLEQGIYFPFVCGLSAGASNTVNYLSRDRTRVKWAFTDLAADKEAGGIAQMLKGNGYINGDYVYRGLIDEGVAPFDWDTFSENPANMRIQAFERDTGMTHVWDTADIGDVHKLIDVVRASSTLPWLMHPIEIDGQVMLDGGLGRGAGIPVWLAEDAGFDRFLFLATRPKGYRKEPFSGATLSAILAFTSDYPQLREALLTRWERYNAELERVEELERQGRCLIVRPDEMLVESTTFDVPLLRHSFDLGRAHALRDLPRWREFLFGSATAGPRAGKTAARPTLGSPGYIEIA